MSKTIFITVLMVALTSGMTFAQGDPFGEPDIQKVPVEERDQFQRQFSDVNWSGAGFDGSVVIDNIPTSEVRARLQAVYGDPTQKLEHLIDQPGFSGQQYIQFEYWFIINDEIPMMVLDVDGPFGSGLVFGGASRYIDMMPEIKRTFSRKLMEAEELGEFKDPYYDIENRIWYSVEYKDGSFSREELSGRPSF